MYICRCENWYHLNCINYKDGDEELIDVFVCPVCESETGNTTSWRLKCERLDCRRASRSPTSVYCSDACGINVMSFKIKELNLNHRSFDSIRHLINHYNKLPSNILDSDDNILNHTRKSNEYKRDNDLIASESIRKTIESDEIQINLIKVQEQYLELAISRSKTLNDVLKHKPNLATVQQAPAKRGRGRKVATSSQPSQFCGFDYRLLADDVEWNSLNINEVEQMSVEEDEALCKNVERSCTRHSGLVRCSFN